MKKLIIAVLFIITFGLVSCADDKVISGNMYRTYGLLNEDEVKNDSIAYKPSVGSIVVGIVFWETIVAPVYTFGFDLFEPVGKK